MCSINRRATKNLHADSSSLTSPPSAAYDDVGTCAGELWGWPATPSTRDPALALQRMQLAQSRLCPRRVWSLVEEPGDPRLPDGQGTGAQRGQEPGGLGSQDSSWAKEPLSSSINEFKGDSLSTYNVLGAALGAGDQTNEQRCRLSRQHILGQEGVAAKQGKKQHGEAAGDVPEASSLQEVVSKRRCDGQSVSQGDV